jgi:hypothetical protein
MGKGKGLGRAPGWAGPGSQVSRQPSLRQAPRSRQHTTQRAHATPLGIDSGAAAYELNTCRDGAGFLHMRSALASGMHCSQ